MSSSFTSSSCGRVPILICSICLENLATDFPGKSKIVQTDCGHVFHKWCLQNSYIADKSALNGVYRCPFCKQTTTTDCSIELYLQMQVDYDRLALVERNKSLCNENAELKKQINVSELRLMCLESDREQNFALCNVTWTGLTNAFQNELLKKIETNYSEFNIHNLKDFSFLRPITLLQIIKPEPKKIFVICNIVEDYFNKHTCLNVTLDNCKNVFKNDFQKRLVDACKIPLLNLDQIPVSQSIMHMLACLEHEGQGRGYDKGILAEIASVYLARFSIHDIKELCKIRIIQLISSQVNSQVEFQIPCVDMKDFDLLLKTGMLKQVEGKIDFTHCLIKYYITAFMISLTVKVLGMSLANARQVFFGRTVRKDSLEEYCVRYLNDLMNSANSNASIDVMKFKRAFNVKENDIIKLLAILAVMNLKNAKDLTKVIKMFEGVLASTGNTFTKIEYPCSIGNSDKFLTLSHFAALRGRLNIMEELYSIFDLAGEASLFDFDELVHYCASWTLFSSDYEIRERKKVISFIMSLKNREGASSKGKSNNTPTTVHISLILFVLKTEHFQDIWNVDLMLHECMSFLSKSQFCDLLPCVLNPEEWIRIVEVYNCNGVVRNLKNF